MVGVSPKKERGSSRFEDQFINEKDSVACELVEKKNQVDKDWQKISGNLEKRLSEFEKEKIQLLEIEERILKKMENVEEMLEKH